MRIITLVLLACTLGSTAHAQQVKPTAPNAGVGIRGFSVVLLLGEQQGSIPAEGLSPSALRALADIKEFLPYKGYRVLDTQWVAGSDIGSSSGRIRSLDNFTLNFQVDTFPGGARFRLENLGARSAEKRLLENSFGIKPGETVVVGTSRVTQADSALIVLLTAVAAK